MTKITNLIIIFLVAFMLLVNGAVAKSELKEEKDIEDCQDNNDENVKEEVVGLSPDGKDILMKRTISHPVKEKVSKAIGSSRCYKLMGIKWSITNVPYTINPTGSNAGTDAVVTAFTASGQTWDGATSRPLFGLVTTDEAAGYGYDGKNTMFFGSSLGSRTIAQSTVWYYIISRQIVEFDIQYNTYFSWGDAEADPTKMDLAGIATHEIGHGIGLADLYTTLCKDVTMYGYSTEGEYKKRTLESGDLTGLWKIYGQ